MQFDDYSLGEPAAWGAVSPQAGDIVRDAMMKEKVIKFVGYALSKLTRTEPQFSFFHREILSCQDDLRGA